AVLLSACPSLPGRSAEEDAQVVAAVDWSRVEHVKIELRDSGVLPQEVRFRAGQPYRLTLLNAGVNNHYFNAPEFYRSIAVLKAEVPRYAEIKAARITTLEVFAAGGTVDLWFVPLEKGRFVAHCHLGNHRDMGVEARVVVE
ncbi:MAG: multicopper oxidase domain-containing protein, partial [Lysobacter sp.]|nr:multicopper oxidase domain-containing protein [Lysobacter sp.]